MDTLSMVLAAACALLVVVALALVWLHWRPRISIELPGRAPVQPAPPPPPTHAKCNTKHFIFTRKDPETGETIQGDVWRHPYCENLDYQSLTDVSAYASWLGGHPEPGWEHTETRGETHFVKL